MKQITIIVLILLSWNFSFAQEQVKMGKTKHKGDFYAYWGWNWGNFTKSDISFKGTDYDFLLKSVTAHDRPTPFSFSTYFNPARLSIPQYNFRFGYFISDNYNISVGVDHMKYVMDANQVVKISGEINGTDTIFDGSYNDDDIVLTEDFLTFEHTDGLNYINVEFRRFDEILNFNHVKVNLTEGLGTGFLFPKTNTKLLNHERYDEFHVAGYGFSAVVGLNLAIYKHFFIQSEFKGGFINMPDIRTTISPSDRAGQSFYFSQVNIVFGATFKFRKPKQ